MDKIENKWRSFLSENEEIPYQIYCDMDGVLVDLEAGIEETLVFADIEDDAKEQAIQVVNSGMLWQTLQQDPRFSKGAQAIFDILSKGTEAEREAWWANLPPRGDMPVLWNHIYNYNPKPIILSAPWTIDGIVDEACVRGKERWIRNSLPSQPQDIIITPNKKVHADRRHILIDDMDKYVERWREAKGIAIQHTDAKNSIEVLKKRIYKNI